MLYGKSPCVKLKNLQFKHPVISAVFLNFLIMFLKLKEQVFSDLLFLILWEISSILWFCSCCRWFQCGLCFVLLPCVLPSCYRPKPLCSRFRWQYYGTNMVSSQVGFLKKVLILPGFSVTFVTKRDTAELLRVFSRDISVNFLSFVK